MVRPRRHSRGPSRGQLLRLERRRGQPRQGLSAPSLIRVPWQNGDHHLVAAVAGAAVLDAEAVLAGAVLGGAVALDPKEEAVGALALAKAVGSG
jgi:hypothetical protein